MDMREYAALQAAEKSRLSDLTLTGIAGHTTAYFLMATQNSLDFFFFLGGGG